MTLPDRRVAANHDTEAALRVRLAASLRRLSHALVAHEVDTHLLEEMSGESKSWLERVEQGPSRVRKVVSYVQEVTGPGVQDGQAFEHFLDCPLSGRSNPFAIEMSARREGDEAVVLVTLGEGHEGVPGRSHGGIVAAVLDEVNGFVTTMLKVPTVTGELTVRYHQPTPIGKQLEFRGRVVTRTRRKLIVEIIGICEGREICSASAVQVIVDPDTLDRGRLESVK